MVDADGIDVGIEAPARIAEEITTQSVDSFSGRIRVRIKDVLDRLRHRADAAGWDCVVGERISVQRIDYGNSVCIGNGRSQ